MIQNTTIADTLNTATDKIRYDEACKQLLSEKIILAWIMKSCLEEYADADMEEIASQYIEGTPEIGKMPSPQDIINAPKIWQTGTEDSTIAGQTIIYDIRFSAVTPETDRTGSVRLLINAEAQNDYYPGYPLVKRAIYYSCRMISTQSGTEFTSSHYEKIRKVYSIWLCMNPPQKRQKTITRYSIREENIYGRITEDREKYDLLSVVMICLGKPQQMANPNATQAEKLIRLLEVLFSLRISATEKKQILINEYDIIVTESIERLVDDMCNLSDGVEAIGFERGLEQGLEAIVETCKDFGSSFIDTVGRVASKFNMTQQEAEETVRKYW